MRAIARLAEEAAGCVACPLHERATQTVFGRGPDDSSIVLVGEQPGDQEDRAGEPFVGPAGRVLHECMDLAGIDPSSVYVTNAVKHFKWQPRGKARIHKTPTAGEIMACRPWIEQELRTLQPKVVVALGATAARSLLGHPVKIKDVRGAPIESASLPDVVVTIHPSAVLRTRGQPDRQEMRDGLIADLRTAAAHAAT